MFVGVLYLCFGVCVRIYIYMCVYMHGEKLRVLHPSFVRFTNISPGSNWLQDGPTLLPLSLALYYLSELLVPYHQS